MSLTESLKKSIHLLKTISFAPKCEQRV